MSSYDNFNREERAICAHLFRLLHEKIYDPSNPLKDFFGILSDRLPEIKTLRYENVGLYCEVAIIRDAYHAIKNSNLLFFMDELTKLLIIQESVNDCRLYSELPETLRNPKCTHPNQIKQKALTEGYNLSIDERKVYGAMQGMFNAKPDLVITVDDLLLVIEAKFTESFDEIQFCRTRNIADVWSKLLYKELGFQKPPSYHLLKLGASKFNPDISWSDILKIAEKTYPPNDRSLHAIKSGLDLLKYYKLEN